MGLEILTIEERIQEHVATLRTMVKEYSKSENGISASSQGVIVGLNLAIVSATTWLKSELESEVCNGK